MWSEVYLRILRPKRRHRPLLKRLLKVPLNQLQRRQHPQSHHRPYLQQQMQRAQTTMRRAKGLEGVKVATRRKRRKRKRERRRRKLPLPHLPQ